MTIDHSIGASALIALTCSVPLVAWLVALIVFSIRRNSELQQRNGTLSEQVAMLERRLRADPIDSVAAADFWSLLQDSGYVTGARAKKGLPNGH